MLRAYGLYSYIQKNRLKSILLLVSFVFLLQAVLYSFSLVIEAFSGDGDVPEIMARAWERMATVAPLGMLGALIWFIIAYFAHERMIAFATGSRSVSREEAFKLYNALENLCISRGIPMPKLRIIETDAANAFASGLKQRDYSVTVTRGLIDSLNDAELEAVLAHELTHIRNRDTQMMVIAVIFAGLFAFIADVTIRNLDFPFGRGPRFPASSRSGGRKNAGAVIIVILIAIAIIAISWGLSTVIRFAISRSREFMADAGAVDLTKNPDAMISALRKIEGHAAIVDMPSRMHAFFIETPAVTPVSGLLATHPPIEERIAALIKYGGGQDVRGDVQADQGQA
jgi:heat shock protein HtpX